MAVFPISLGDVLMDTIQFIVDVKLFIHNSVLRVTLIGHCPHRYRHFDRREVSYQGLLKQLMQTPYEALSSSSMTTLEAGGLRLASEVSLSNVLAAVPNPEAELAIPEMANKVGVDGAKLRRYCTCC
jgi:hypothetical protein